MTRYGKITRLPAGIREELLVRAMAIFQAADPAPLGGGHQGQTKSKSGQTKVKVSQTKVKPKSRLGPRMPKTKATHSRSVDYPIFRPPESNQVKPSQTIWAGHQQMVED